MDSMPRENAQCPIDRNTVDAHVDIGSIPPSKGLCLNPLVHLARAENGGEWWCVAARIVMAIRR